MNIMDVKLGFKTFILTIFCLFIMLLLIPIIFPILFIIYGYSQLTFLFIKWKYGRSLSKPSGMDIVNGKENEISRPYINIAFRFSNQNPDIVSVKERFQKVILDQKKENGKQIFSKFTKIFEKIGDIYVWRDSENFDLNNHIKIVDSSEIINKYIEITKKQEEMKGNKIGDEEELDLTKIRWETLVNLILNDYGARPVDPGLPKWEILIFPETEKRFTTLFRVHHSITDGLYFLRLLTECLADHPVEVRLPYKTQNGNIFQRSAQNLLSFFLLPYGVYKGLTLNDRNPLHGMKLTGRKRFYLADQVDTNLLKDIKKVARVSVNDIIFSAISYAVAKHFEMRSATVDQITVLLAINLRVKNNKPIRLKNNFAVTHLKLPTSLSGFFKNSSQNKKCTILERKTSLYELSKMPALCRLQSVKNVLDEAKRDPCLVPVSWVLTTLSFLLPASVAEAIFSADGVTMDISNINGPQDNDFGYNDAQVDDVTFWLPDRDPLGIGVSCSSYNGFLRAGLIVDEAIMNNDDEAYYFLNNFREGIHNVHREIESLKSAFEKSASEVTAFIPKDIP